MIKIESENTEYNGTVKAKACELGYDKAKIAPIVVKSEPEYVNGKEVFEGTCPGGDKHKDFGLGGTPEEGYVYCGHSTGGNYTARGMYTKKNTFYKIEKTITTRTWEYAFNGEDTEYTWETYRYRVYKYSDKERKNGKTYVASFFIDYVLRYKTDAELKADGIIDDNGNPVDTTKCSHAAKSIVNGEPADADKCCENCRKYIKRIIKLLKSGNDEDFDTYTPYISKVTGHWYRDVYFVTKGNDAFVQLDEEYEAIMGERWTLYETDDETGLYKLYKLNSDGSIGEPFNGTQPGAD